MAKGDDYKMKIKNKVHRKKLSKDSSSASVSARVAALIAAKKRRQSGKRSQCQGMCFTLPSPEDPYNDRQGKPDERKKKKTKGPSKEIGERQQKRKSDGDDEKINLTKPKKLKKTGLEYQQKADLEKRKTRHLGDSGCPSKFLLMCLNSIQDTLPGDGELTEEKGKPLFVNPWGVQFWNSYSLGNDVLEKSGTSPSVEQIAWIASTAADSISRIEKDGISFRSPFLLYLVSSQEKAIKVRSVCKPLKASGVHTVILHPGTSVEHQIDGLKSCEPEFLIATPERLWELISLKAVDVAGVSLLVVDAMDALPNCLDVVKQIKDSISGDHRTIVFQGSCTDSSVQSIQDILQKPFHTLSLRKLAKNKGIKS